jgi:hypothetical protein
MPADHGALAVRRPRSEPNPRELRQAAASVMVNKLSANERQQQRIPLYTPVVY